jgi:hypothetical protein
MKSSSSLMSDPGHWRQRAEEVRKMAASMIDPQSKAVMLGIAKDYDGLAERAAARAERRMQSK